ncbi:MAG TPA: aldo/keto reductase, partial [Candidatus Eubacterium avistercoris]|nr:aldo/keto reductase [Candidatus Eubacterium avistercoris]
DQSVNREGSVLEYSRLKDMTIQAWSPFQKGFFGGPFLGDMEQYGELNKTIDRIAKKYEVTNTAIAVAWITRHPANIQVILGTTNPQRIKDACRGSDILLTRDEWYEIYQSSGKILP